MAQDDDFLRRWSRRKRQAAAAATAPASAPEAPPPTELPPLDSVNFESDFKAFMHAKVEESVKRAALKKLFSDPRFNVMDGLDVYIDDYTKGETLTPEMVAALEHAKATLRGPKTEEPQEKEAPVQEAKKPQDDGNPGQDA